MKIILTTIIFLILSFTTFSQAGKPDPFFGVNGKSLILTNNKSAGCINDIEQQPDGKIIAAGEEYYSTQVYNPIVVRYKTDGTADSSFGENGFADVLVNSNHKFDAALAVKVLSDGKILVLINAQNALRNSPNVYLVKLNADGSRDASFGKNGVLIKDIGIDYAYAMQTQADGKILVGGQISSIGFIARFNEDGSTDESFGRKGLILLLAGTSSVVNVITLTSDQKILVGGSGRPDAQSQEIAFVKRFTVTGEPDVNFGINGSVITKTPAYWQTISSIVVLPDDAFLVSYFLLQNTYFYSVSALAKYNADGKIDADFGKDGIVTSGIPKKFLYYRTAEISLQQDGKIVFAGQLMDEEARYAIAVTRLLPNGENDKSFGNNGGVLTYHYYNKVTCMLIQHDAKIVAGGCVQQSYGGKQHLSLVRYLSDNSNIAALKQDNIIADKRISLYPNPVNDVLHVTGLNGKTITIINIRGDVIKRVIVNSDIYNLNVNSFAKGVYCVKVEGGAVRDGNLKFVKE